MSAWLVRHLVGAAQDLQEEPLPATAQRQAWFLAPTGSALTLGSTQAVEAVDAELADRLGVAVARRRSGGGAVLVGPGEVIWFDVVIPRGDPLWHDDVGRAAWWLGELWQAALVDLGVVSEVWRGPLRRDTLADAVCFGGLGAGEVSVNGRKLVGISQRRSRDQARLQSALLLRWPARLMVDLLRLGPAAAADLAGRAVGVGELPGFAGTDAGELAASVVAALTARLAPNTV